MTSWIDHFAKKFQQTALPEPLNPTPNLLFNYFLPRNSPFYRYFSFRYVAIFKDNLMIWESCLKLEEVFLKQTTFSWAPTSTAGPTPSKPSSSCWPWKSGTRIAWPYFEGVMKMNKFAKSMASTMSAFRGTGTPKYGSSASRLFNFCLWLLWLPTKYSASTAASARKFRRSARWRRLRGEARW